MLSHVFLGMSLIGAEWVLYFLVLLSVVSVALIFERVRYYSQAVKGLEEFRNQLRNQAASRNWESAAKAAQSRAQDTKQRAALDLESEMALALITHAMATNAKSRNPEVLTEVANDSVMRTRLMWEKNLSILATIGSNAPFVGLFGTVLGIIKAFHDLSQQSSGAQTVTAGISEALVATAVGLLVAIPAVVAFNFFQRRVKSALAEAESLKSFLIGKLAE